MDRRLQSSLDKKTRVGWQTRVYRLERGYLSGWADVSSAAAQEEPSRVICLFQGDQVATLSDQGEKRFKLDFPWDGAKTLQLRSNNSAMKEAWVSLLRATLQEAESQIKSTGSVFAYGGSASHEQDEAYEEAAYLKTNRFLAAYVVDEQSRASYVNDLLNEGFQHVGDRPGGGGDARRACAGARAAITELLGLTEDFKEEMEGVEELRQGNRSGESSSSELNPSVAAPKIQRFCEEHMSLVGRTISSRLMLELSPFMDSSVAGTAAAPTDSTRAELVATRKMLDEAYDATDRVIILGTRAWFADIRDYFLDCAGLERALQAPPSPPPEVATQTADFGSPPAAPAGANQRAAGEPAPPLPEGSAGRSSSKALLQVSSAFSAAKAATKGGASRMGSSLSIKGRSTGKAAAAGAGTAAENGADTEQVGGVGVGAGMGTGGRVSSRAGGSMSIPGVFRRGSSRGAAQKEQAPAAPPSPSPPTKGSPRGGATSGGGNASKPPDNEERERSDLFGGSSRSPSTSPRASPKTSPNRKTPHRSPFSPAGPSDAGAASSSSATGASQSAAAATGVAAASSLPTGARGPAARKEKRAFAGGAWNGGGGGSDVAAQQTTETGSSAEPLPLDEEAVTTAAATAGQAADSAVPSSSAAESTAPKPKVIGGGKRRFAGGIFSGPAPAAAGAAPQPTVQPASDNPFAAGDGGAGGARVMAGGRAGAARAGAARGASPGGGGQGPASGGRGVEQAVPAWAASAGAAEESAPPAWAAPAFASEPSPGGGKGGSSGLAPPSRADQGQRRAAEKSPLLTVDPAAPPARRPSQRRPGEAGSRRAFGGGERLF